ncbi:MAG: metallophosphoesterase [Acidobacteria bacterium]|nr:metallophosphoesterase [Acidobacteriota bacterium]MBI3280487.1 metallophosphoesterase [Acidobacteriota bacterium]
MATLLIFSDIHGDHAALQRLMDIEADYYIAAGDLTNWGRGLDACGVIMKPRAERTYVLPGNHESANQVGLLCEKFGFHNLHGRTMQIGTWQVAGLGYSSPTPFDTPGEYSEAEIAERLAGFEGLNPMVLICHSPPYGTALDQIRPGVHAGSKSVLDFIRAQKPRYFFCGHVHEAAGVHAEIGATKGVNVGRRGYLLKLD